MPTQRSKQVWNWGRFWCKLPRLGIAQLCIASHAMKRQGAVNAWDRFGLILQGLRNAAGAMHFRSITDALVADKS